MQQRVCMKLLHGCFFGGFAFEIDFVSDKFIVVHPNFFSFEKYSKDVPLGVPLELRFNDFL